MEDYKVTVSTSYVDDAGTSDQVFIKLVGTDGNSKRTRLMDTDGDSSFMRGSVCSFTVSCPVSIGKLVQIELDKQSLFTPENWLPNKVEVKSPEGDLYKFPIYSWITDSQMQSFREGQEPKKQPLRNPDSGPSLPEGDIYGSQINLKKSDSKVPSLIEGTDTGFPASEGVTFNVPGYRQIGAPQEEKDIGFPAPEVYTLDFNSYPQNGAPQEGTEPEKKPFRGPDIGFSSPAGDTFNFTIYCGNTDSTGPRVREGKGDTFNFVIYCRNTDNKVPEKKIGLYDEFAGQEAHMPTILTTNTRQAFFGWFSQLPDRNQREKDYRWSVHKKGIPHIMEAEDLSGLPSEVKFSWTKDLGFKLTAAKGLVELHLKGLATSTENWRDIDDIKGVFWCKHTDISDYVQEHWREDDFFGYQFLNGVHPMIIQRCSALPDNFPVTDSMVFPSGQFSLEDEMEIGNIFLCDYKRLDGVKANTIHGKQQYLMAPLVLLHKTPDDKLMPLAIQLKQIPADDNPIFLPTDSEYDWLTAKIFVRSADFNEHQLNAHLLRTHLLAEVFTVSLLRNVSRKHPLYKVLVPHTRYTLHINFLARENLISETGVFTKFAASGGEGMTALLKSSLSSVTYRSLCIPEDIVDRGLMDLPNFYYRDDGLRLWDIIHRFVKGILGFYYKSDTDVQEDTELQLWISDIFEHGFLSQEDTGIPQSFTNVAELVKFVTMVIFTCSGQHSAVNTGQYDYGGWMPNTPTSLQLPPPTKKGTTSEATILQTLPDMGTTANGMAAIWLLSQPSADFVGLGESLEDHHDEEIAQHYIKAFQGELKALSSHIFIRNRSLTVPYTYMDPKEVENSVAV